MHIGSGSKANFDNSDSARAGALHSSSSLGCVRVGLGPIWGVKMAAVRVESEAFSDLRYDRLAYEANLADADHARGKMLRIWRQCTIQNRHYLDTTEIELVLGEHGVQALLISGLAELIRVQGCEVVRIKGTDGRVEWLANLRNNGRKGGRPPKTRSKPSGFDTAKPEANHLGVSANNPLALALATATAQKEKDQNPVPLKASPLARFAPDVQAVYAVWRSYHPRAPERLDSGAKSYALIRARLTEGRSVQDLQDAVRGYHRSPHHLGENDRKTKYLSLELICRDDGHVQAGIEMPENKPSVSSGSPWPPGYRPTKLEEEMLYKHPGVLVGRHDDGIHDGMHIPHCPRCQKQKESECQPQQKQA